MILSKKNELAFLYDSWMMPQGIKLLEEVRLKDRVYYMNIFMGTLQSTNGYVSTESTVVGGIIENKL